MTAARPSQFLSWNDLLPELQLVTLSELSLPDLEYFSYASWGSRKLYSTVVDGFFRPEIERFYRQRGISQPIPPNAFLCRSILGDKQTFVLNKRLAEALGRLVGFLQHPMPDVRVKRDFASFAHYIFYSGHTPLKGTNADKIHLLLPIFHWHLRAIGLELNEEERKKAFITPESGLHETRKFASSFFLNSRIHDYHDQPRLDDLGNTSTYATEEIDKFGRHLTTLGLTSLFSRIRDRLQFVVLPQASPERRQLMGKVMDERSAFLATLTGRSWSEKETKTKTALCNNDPNLYVCDKPTAEVVYRRICALGEHEAVFFYRALFTDQDATQQRSRFDSVQLLQVLTALDNVAQTAQGKAFVESLLDVNDEGSNDYKLAVFKYLLQGCQDNHTVINPEIFSVQNLTDMFNATGRLREEFRDHDLDEVAWACLLVLHMSAFHKEVKDVTHFVATLVHIKQNHPDAYDNLMQVVRHLLTDFLRSEMLPIPVHRDPLLPLHCLLFNIDAYWISEKLVTLFNHTRANVKYEQFYVLFRPWWDKCHSEEERGRNLPGMQRIAASDHFSTIVSFFLDNHWESIAKTFSHYHLIDGAYICTNYSDQSKLLRPDSTLWCLSLQSLDALFSPDTRLTVANLQLLCGIAHTNKERLLPRIQKLGPDFLILNQLAPSPSRSWLFALLFILPDSLFEVVLPRITPVLHAQQSLASKKAELERILAGMGDLPGVLLYLNHRKARDFYNKHHVFDAIPGSVLAQMNAIEYMSPPAIFLSPPSRGDLFSFVIRLINSPQLYGDDREVQAIDMPALVQFITQHLTDEKFLTFLRTKIGCFYGESVNTIPSSMIPLEKYRLDRLAEEQQAASAPGHSPRLFATSSQSLVALATAAGITTRLSTGTIEAVSTASPNPVADNRF